MAFFLFHHSCGRVFLRSHDVALDFLARVGGLYFAKNAKTLARLSVRHSIRLVFGFLCGQQRLWNVGSLTGDSFFSLKSRQSFLLVIGDLLYFTPYICNL